MALADRFWDRVERTDTCWLWLGGRSEGYGTLSIGGRKKRAHRVAWEMTVGPVPAGLDVLHRCDNPPCVRPDHLWIGTRAENTRDRDQKGRAAKGERHGTHTHPESFRGERHGRAKLTEDQVREIRLRLASGDIPSGVAKEFGVSRRAIRSIRAGVNWGWLS